MIEPIATIDDPRVAAYRNLRDRTLRGESIYLAEGELVARRLLCSGYPVESVLASAAFAAAFDALAAGRAPVYLADEALLRQIAGFPFHRGVLAVGRRIATLGIGELLARVAPAAAGGAATLVVCPEITKPENAGLVLRTAAGLGGCGVLLGERSCDPFSRRALRVSMGGVFYTPLRKSDDLAGDLAALRARGYALVAAVLDPAAERLERFCWPPKSAIVIGNEFAGLGAVPCDHRVTIPMRPEVDSLNLGVAASLFLYARWAYTAAGTT